MRSCLLCSHVRGIERTLNFNQISNDTTVMYVYYKLTMFFYVITYVDRFKYLFCRGRVGMKKSDNLDPRTGKSRTTIKEPKLLRSHQPNRYVFQQAILIYIYCIKAQNRNKLMLQNPGSSFVIWYIDFTWSIKGADRNHSSIVVKKKTDFILPTPPETSQWQLEARKENDAASSLTYIISLLDLRAMSDKLNFFWPQVDLDFEDY